MIGWWIAVAAVAVLVEMGLRYTVARVLRAFGMRLPSLSESFILAAQTAHICISGCVVLRERVSEDALLEAMTVLSATPAARTRISKWAVKHVAPPIVAALRVEYVADLDDTTLVDVLEDEINHGFGDTECPIRAVLVRCPTADAIVLSCCHIIFDGLSACEIMRRLLLLVRNPHTRFDTDLPGVVRSSDDYLVIPAFMCVFALQGLLALGEYLRELRLGTLSSHAQPSHGSRSAVSLSDTGKWSRRHAQVVVATFDAPLSAALVQRCRTERTTIGCLVAAATMQSLLDYRNGSNGVWVSLQGDFRRMWNHSSTPFLFGNLTPVLSFSKRVVALQAQPVWEQSRELAHELRTHWNILRVTVKIERFRELCVCVCVCAHFAHAWRVSGIVFHILWSFGTDWAADCAAPRSPLLCGAARVGAARDSVQCRCDYGQRRCGRCRVARAIVERCRCVSNAARRELYWRSDRFVRALVVHHCVCLCVCAV